MHLFRRVAVLATIVGLAGVWISAQERSLDVVVSYQSAEVNATHAIYVVLFDNPQFNEGGEPIALQMVMTNGGTASFSNLAVSPVYVAAIYDEQGGGTTLSINPSGFPAGAVMDASFAPMAVALTEGETTTVELTFNDAVRLP